MGFLEGGVEFIEFSVPLFKRPFVSSGLLDFDDIEHSILFSLRNFLKFWNGKLKIK